MKQPEPAVPPPLPPAARLLPSAPPAVAIPNRPAPSPNPPLPAPPLARILLPLAVQHLLAVGPRPGGQPYISPPCVATITPGSCVTVPFPGRLAAPIGQLGAGADPLAAGPLVAGPIVAGPAAPYRPTMWGSSPATAREAVQGPAAEVARVPLVLDSREAQRKIGCGFVCGRAGRPQPTAGNAAFCAAKGNAPCSSWFCSTAGLFASLTPHPRRWRKCGGRR